MEIKKIEKILQKGGIEEYKKEARILALEISGLTQEDIFFGKKIPDFEKITALANLRAKTRKPIQHLLGYGYFMDEKYIVNESVLIPRDETEILVRKGFELLKKRSGKINILDIGTGSGCISCALAKLLKNFDAEILAVDVSADAIITAMENVSRLDLVRKVILRKSDLFSKIRNCEKFDLIISNPPYIPISQKENLQFEVKNFDPELALFAKDEQGIEFYKKIIEKAPYFLKKDGFLAFELGIGQKNPVQKMMEKDFCEIGFEKDLAGIYRVIWGKIK